MNSSSVFFVFTLPVSDECTSESSRLPLNGGLARTRSKASAATAELRSVNLLLSVSW